MNNNNLEKLGLNLSIAVTLFMSILGLGFGTVINSDAILLDGFFNVISFIVAIAALWVFKLVKKGEGKSFQFGYLGFIPLINLTKGLMMLVLSIFAVISAIAVILHGGTELNPGIAIIYPIIAASGCLITALIEQKIFQKTGSALIKVDAQNWLINGFISLSVGLAFGLIIFIQNTPLSWFVPYADSSLVILLVLITLPLPVNIIWENTKQLLLGAPNAEIEAKLKQVFIVAIENFPCAKYWLRMTQAGSNIYVNIYWLLPETFTMNNFQELDKIRQTIIDTLRQEYKDLNVDIIFTQDTQWAELINAAPN